MKTPLSVLVFLITCCGFDTSVISLETETLQLRLVYYNPQIGKVFKISVAALKVSF